MQRKAALIGEMLRATGPILKPWYGPLVPGKAESMRPELVCDAAAEGLITGKMDGQRPVLYVHAVSYAGLMGAAELARRVKQPTKADVWGRSRRRCERPGTRRLLRGVTEMNAILFVDCIRHGWWKNGGLMQS